MNLKGSDSMLYGNLKKHYARNLNMCFSNPTIESI